VLSSSVRFSAPSFWMGGGLKSRCVDRVYGADGAVRIARWNSTPNAPDDGRMYPKHVDLRILTYSIVQSPSSEANWFAASQEIPRTSRNPKAHYRTHKRPPPVSILGQPNPVHIPTSHLLEIHPNIIHSSMPRSPQWSLSFRFSHQDPILI